MEEGNINSPGKFLWIYKKKNLPSCPFCGSFLNICTYMSFIQKQIE